MQDNVPRQSETTSTEPARRLLSLFTLTKMRWTTLILSNSPLYAFAAIDSSKNDRENSSSPLLAL